MKKLIFFVFLWISFHRGLCQNEDHVIMVTGKALESEILLRWAPNSHIGWQLGNKYGYKVERTTLLRDGKVLDIPETALLNVSPLKPAPLSHFEDIYESDEYAAIAAQALYGESFAINNDIGDDLVQTINKIREDEARFSFTLYCADNSIKVAGALGLFYRDNKALPNEKYLYKISIWVPDRSEISPGTIYLGLDSFSPLPVPNFLEAEFDHKFVLLSWPGHLYTGVFNSYILERSDDGGATYFKLNHKPFAFTDPGDLDKDFILMDSLPDGNKEYFYRIRGADIFGGVSEPSEAVSGKARLQINGRPQIIGHEVVDNEVRLNWTFPQENLPEIEGFKVLRTSDPGAPYHIISDLNKSDKVFTDRSPHSSNYYMVQAYNMAGQYINSFPVLVQLKDSIPPDAPLGLHAEVDPLGIVKVSWDHGTEKDLLGYRVFKSNFKDSEFYQVNSGYLNENTFYDTLDLNTLSDKVYYKVLAVDHHLNRSGFSSVLEVQRPDITPPVPPIIKNMQVLENGVKISWINSTSLDVEKHILYKREQGAQMWEVASVFNGVSVKSYIDEKCEPDRIYDYLMIALDGSGNESMPAKPARVKTGPRLLRPMVKDVFARADRENGHIELRWDYRANGLARFKVYRSEGNRPLALYKDIDSRDPFLYDKGILANSEYTYRIMAVFNDGSESLLSEVVTINY